MGTIHAALEIGTSRTVLAIAEGDAGGRLRLTCHAEIPSSGIRKSKILNITDATQSIRSVLREIQKREDELGSKLTINNVLLAVSGQHIQFYPAEGSVPIEHARVEDSDLEEAARRARETPLPKGRELLDIVDLDYELDGMGGIVSPKGMSGRVLKQRVIHIHADANRLQDARTAASEAHIEISEPVFAGTCAAEAVLEDHEKRNGALVIDLGGGSTGYAVYLDGHLVQGEVIGVGGDHVTNDIAHAFQTTNAQAERLKTTEASAMLGQHEGDAARVRIVGSSALMENRTVSRRALDTVVNARMKELFTIIREELESAGILHRLHAGIVLTGGGADLRQVDALAQQTFGLSVRLGRPIQVDGFEDIPSPWSFATIAGTLLYGFRTNDEKPMFLENLFGRIFK